MGGRKIRWSAVALAGAALAAVSAPIAASPVAPTPTCFGRTATDVGTPGADRIEGSPGPDVIVARGGDDVIFGGDGRDRICGGSGDDRLDGRYGADVLDAGPGDDHAEGGPGTDLLVGGRGNDRLSGGDGDGGDTLVGGADNDVLYGGDGSDDSDHLFGGASDDFLDGGLGGNDYLYGGSGDDYLASGTVSYEFATAPVAADLVVDWPATNGSGEGVDTFSQVEGIVGSDHDDVLIGDEGHEVLLGRAGNDSIAAGGGADTVGGGTGSDDLDGGAGIDVLSFEDLPTGVTASLRDGTAAGTDVDAFRGFEEIRGSFFDDDLTGDDGPNGIYGRFGADTVLALGGDDLIDRVSQGDAGDGNDMCWDSFAVESCEIQGHVDPPPLPFLAEPVQGEPLQRLDAVRGGVAGGLGRPGKRVEAYVRRLTPAGCWWWDASFDRFVRDVCGTPHGNIVPVQGGEWSLRVDAALGPGVYLVGVKWVKRFPHAQCDGAFEPMCVELDVD